MFRALLVLILTTSLQAAEVRVMAAASLTDVLQEIARSYEKTSRDRIVFSFGASNVLARQIAAGAPADVFLSADERSMNRVQTTARVSVLSNQLVIVIPRDAKARPLTSMRAIALAEPSSVPAGIYAREWLQKRGLWNAVRAKVIPTDNVRAALAAVAAGNADAAIVYRTDARISKKVRVMETITDGPRISYPFAVLKDSDQPQAARRFLAFLQSNAARAIFVRHGFDVLR